MFNRKPRRNRLRSILIAAALAVMSGLCLGLVPVQAQCNGGNDPTAPCFAQNNDILGGQRSLLPDDDLVVNVWAESSGSDSVNDYQLNTSQLGITQYSNTQYSLGSCNPGGLSAAQSVIGRVFSLPNDVLVNARPTSDCSDVTLQIIDQLNGSNNSDLNLGLGGTPPIYIALAMADFNLDGYQDIFLIGPDFAQVFSAKCTNDPFASCTGTAGNAISDGLAAGPRYSLNTSWYASPPVTGDFNGDGFIDVAWPTSDSNGNIQVRFMSVCPAANVMVLGQTCTQAFQIIDAGVAISTGATVQNSSRPRPYIALTANNFDGTINTTTGIADIELLVALVSSDDKNATLKVYDFDGSLSPTNASMATVSDLDEDSDNTLPVFLASGQLDPTSQRPEAVFGATKTGDGSVAHRGLLSVITFDASLNMTVNNVSLDTGSNNNHKTRLFGLAVGRFDPPDTSSGNTDFYQQIAALVDHEDESTHVQIFTIRDDPASNSSSFSCSLSATLCLYTDYIVADTSYYHQGVIQLAPLQAGDLQGRSLLLGAPEKTVVTNTQPDLILGLPPMHVDFITPPEGTTPQVYNVSVFPSTFNTLYSFESMTQSEATRMSTTSYTTSTKETVKGKVTYGVPDVNSVSVKVKASATQMHETTVSNTYDTYSGKSDSFDTATEFDDLVAATSFQMNVYSYPVIGQTVCPSDSPNCSADEMVPLEVQYSAPDDIEYVEPAEAANLEWYQPTTEPGNIFSYPGSLGLLAAQTGTPSTGLDPLTPENTFWDPQVNANFSVNWTAGAGSNVSAGSTNTYSFDTKVSVSSKASFVGGSASAGVSFDYNNSSSFSTLNSSSQTFTASTGVTLNRGLGGNATNADLDYEGQSYIYGLEQPAGTIQTDLTVPTTVTTHGRIAVGHAADMLSTSSSGGIQSGDWWKQAYTAAPDLALNHPQRWLQKEPASENDQEVMFNCPIGFASAFGAPSTDPGSCTKTSPPTEPNPTNVADAAFYWMKGFFIIPGTDTTGPTATQATLGDTVTLQARVYNYSLANMPAGTTVHVRFYAQPWDGTAGEFASGSGKYGFANATFIGEDVLTDNNMTPVTIPAFCGGSESADPCPDSTAQNWMLAQVQWDTSTLSPQPTSDTDWKFWVVAWMQDSAGNLVSEIQQHGLTGIPVQDVDSLAEIPVETYSNNLGFYNQVFTLELPTNGTASEVTPNTDQRQLTLDGVNLSPAVVLRDQITTVRAYHRGVGDHFDYVRAFLYDHDPQAGGKLVDMDIIPRVPQDEAFVVPFRYLPRTCGSQQLFLRAVPSDGGPPTEGTFDVFVTRDPVAQTQLLIAQVNSLGLEVGTKGSLLAKLNAAERSFQRGNQMAGLSQLHAFTNELWANSGKKVPAADATRMIAIVDDLGGCL